MLYEEFANINNTIKAQLKNTPYILTVDRVENNTVYFTNGSKCTLKLLYQTIAVQKQGCISNPSKLKPYIEGVEKAQQRAMKAKAVEVKVEKQFDAVGYLKENLNCRQVEGYYYVKSNGLLYVLYHEQDNLVIGLFDVKSNRYKTIKTLDFFDSDFKTLLGYGTKVYFINDCIYHEYGSDERGIFLYEITDGRFQKIDSYTDAESRIGVFSRINERFYFVALDGEDWWRDVGDEVSDEFPFKDYRYVVILDLKDCEFYEIDTRGNVTSLPVVFNDIRYSHWAYYWDMTKNTSSMNEFNETDNTLSMVIRFKYDENRVIKAAERIISNFVDKDENPEEFEELLHSCNEFWWEAEFNCKIYKDGRPAIWEFNVV